MSLAKLEKAIAEARFTRPEVGKKILAALHPVIAVGVDKKAEIKKGSSKLGGKPDLPADVELPEGMVFLAQLNLAEVAAHDKNEILPVRGMLYVFGGEDETDLSSGEGGEAIFHAGDGKSLVAGDKKGKRLVFGPSAVLTDRFDASDEDRFDKLVKAAGLLEPAVGTLLGPPELGDEVMQQIFDAKKDLTVLGLHGSALGDIYSSRIFVVFGRKKSVRKGEFDAYFARYY